MIATPKVSGAPGKPGRPAKRTGTRVVNDLQHAHVDRHRASLPLADELENHLRRVLQVCDEQDHIVSVGLNVAGIGDQTWPKFRAWLIVLKAESAAEMRFSIATLVSRELLSKNRCL